MPKKLGYSTGGQINLWVIPQKDYIKNSTVITIDFVR